MPVDPLVSVILPVYNGAAFLEAAVRSAFAQGSEGPLWGRNLRHARETPPAAGSVVHDDLEILAVDDGSTDTSLAILIRLAGEDAHLRVLRQPNAGRAAARRRAAEEARGGWLAFLDQDDLWDPEKTAAQLAAARCYTGQRDVCDAMWCTRPPGASTPEAGSSATGSTSRPGPAT